MGILDELDVLATIAAIELVLVEMGQTVKLGSGVGAASLVFAEAAEAAKAAHPAKKTFGS
jgi:aspartate aminotransferase-like enzyme